MLSSRKCNSILLLSAASAARRFKLPGHQGYARSLREAAHVGLADIALASFPKSGRTYVRVMLARLYRSAYGHPEENLLQFGSLWRAPSRPPLIAFTHDGDAMRRSSDVDTSKRRYRHCKVALLARHPADVAVSRYFHLKHRSSDPARQALAEQPLESFVWTEQGGIPAIVAFLNSWARQQDAPQAFQIFRYEDFRSAPVETLTALAIFLGLPSTEADILDAVEFATFDNMKAKEAEGYFSSGRMGARKSGEQGSAKVRSGKAGGYAELFDHAALSRIDSYVAESLDPVFGYGRPRPIEDLAPAHAGLSDHAASPVMRRDVVTSPGRLPTEHLPTEHLPTR